MSITSVTFVLGMHRSGTSAAAGALVRLGGRGPDDELPPQADNPRGFAESASIVALNDRLLNKIGRTWDDVFLHSAAAEINPCAEDVEEGAAILLERYSGSGTAIVKDPRASVLVPFWRQVARVISLETKFIIVLRDPEEVAASLGRRNGFPRQQSLLLWLSYVLASLRDTRDSHVHFLSYDELLVDWRSEMERLRAALNGTLLPWSVNQAADVDSFLAPALRHEAAEARDGRASNDLELWADRIFKNVVAASKGAMLDRELLGAAEAWLDGIQQATGDYVRDLRGGRERASDKGLLCNQSLPDVAQPKGLLDQLHTLQGQIGTYHTALLTAQKVSQNLELRNHVLEREIRDARAELKQKLERTVNITQEAESAKGIITALTGEASAMTERIGQYHSALTDAQQTVLALEKSNEALRSQEVDWSTRLQTQTVELVKSHQAIADLSKRVTETGIATDAAIGVGKALEVELQARYVQLRVARERDAAAIDIARNLTAKMTLLEKALLASQADSHGLNQALEAATSDLALQMDRQRYDRRRLTEIDNDLATARRSLKEREAEIAVVLASRSWRVTNPLRQMRRLFSAKPSGQVAPFTATGYQDA